jgi:hypothetical protein
MPKIKLRLSVELEYDNYGGHSLQDFEDILLEGITYLVDEGMISGHLEAILEDHQVSVEEVEEDDD